MIDGPAKTHDGGAKRKGLSCSPRLLMLPGVEIMVELRSGGS